ncbi:hypothetical protein D9V12_09550, partial [Staphylococcus epidermidis]
MTRYPSCSEGNISGWTWFSRFLANRILEEIITGVSSDTFSKQTLNYTWVLGGLLGVIYLTGNLLLLPRLGAALTVVITVT